MKTSHVPFSSLVQISFGITSQSVASDHDWVKLLSHFQGITQKNTNTSALKTRKCIFQSEEKKRLILNTYTLISLILKNKMIDLPKNPENVLHYSDLLQKHNLVWSADNVFKKYKQTYKTNSEVSICCLFVAGWWHQSTFDWCHAARRPAKLFKTTGHCGECLHTV